MNTLTKLALGLIGQLQPRPATGDGTPAIRLPPPRRRAGAPLLQALAQRGSQRAFATRTLPRRVLGELLWAAAGVNRPALHGRTAPSALNAQEVQLYVAMAQGLYRYDADGHGLQRVAAQDVRRVTGYQDFVDSAPLDLVYVADHARMGLVPAAQRERFAFAAAGAMAQNVYLYAASEGLATVLRAWLDRQALERAMGLGPDQQVLLAQTVGWPAVAGRPCASDAADASDASEQSDVPAGPVASSGSAPLAPVKAAATRARAGRQAVRPPAPAAVAAAAARPPGRAGASAPRSAAAGSTRPGG
jgi:SagB-type dehydrogenase family enzyme